MTVESTRVLRLKPVKFCVADGRAHFAPDLADSVAFGDAHYAEICEVIRKSCAARATRPPETAPRRRFTPRPPRLWTLAASARSSSRRVSGQTTRPGSGFHAFET